MIERLFNEEVPREGPEYSKAAAQITQAQQALAGRLDQEGQVWLERLSDAYIHQSNAMLKDVFAEGFCAAVELMLDYLRRKSL